MKLHEIAEHYKDEYHVNELIYYAFQQNMESDKALFDHRFHVEQNQLGYGDRAFHWMWKLLVDEMPQEFSFLEIGVFKGQTLSLVKMLADLSGKHASVAGVTPLTSAGDKYCPVHPGNNFAADIENLFKRFTGGSEYTIIKGLSNDPVIIQQVADMGDFDIVYIDGCHDYDVVVSDIMQYRERVKHGGYLVIDDCSNNMKMPAGLFTGLPDVTRAVEFVLDIDKTRFKHLFACGHNRIWQRV